MSVYVSDTISSVVFASSSTEVSNTFVHELGVSPSSKGVGVQGTVSKNVAETASTLSIYFTARQGVTNNKFTVTQGSHSCVGVFGAALSGLPVAYDEQTYVEFVELWGTHVITSASVGGFIETHTAVSFCTVAQSSSLDVSASLADEIRSFSASMVLSKRLMASQTITVSDQTVCGGNSNVYNEYARSAYSGQQSSNPFKVWLSTVSSSSYPSTCLLKMTLTPLQNFAQSQDMYTNIEKGVTAYLRAAESRNQYSASAPPVSCIKQSSSGCRMALTTSVAAICLLFMIVSITI